MLFINKQSCQCMCVPAHVFEPTPHKYSEFNGPMPPSPVIHERDAMPEDAIWLLDIAFPCGCSWQMMKDEISLKRSSI